MGIGLQLIEQRQLLQGTKIKGRIQIIVCVVIVLFLDT